MQKFGRLAITVTISLDDSLPEITQETTNDELLNIIYRAARGKNAQAFADDVAIWHTLAGYQNAPGETVEQKDIEILDKQLIHSMALQRAQVLLASPQMLQAMLLTFSQLLPNIGIFDAPPQPHKDAPEDSPGADDLLQ